MICSSAIHVFANGCLAAARSATNRVTYLNQCHYVRRYRQLVAVRKRCGYSTLAHKKQLSDAKFRLAIALRSVGDPEQAEELLISVRESLLRYPKQADTIRSVEEEMATTASACARKKLEK